MEMNPTLRSLVETMKVFSIHPIIAAWKPSPRTLVTKARSHKKSLFGGLPISAKFILKLTSPRLTRSLKIILLTSSEMVIKVQFFMKVEDEFDLKIVFPSNH